MKLPLKGGVENSYLNQQTKLPILINALARSNMVDHNTWNIKIINLHLRENNSQETPLLLSASNLLLFFLVFLTPCEASPFLMGRGGSVMQKEITKQIFRNICTEETTYPSNSPTKAWRRLQRKATIIFKTTIKLPLVPI